MLVVGKVQTSSNVILEARLVEPEDTNSWSFNFCFRSAAAIIMDNPKSLGIFRFSTNIESTYWYLHDNLGNPDFPYKAIIYYQEQDNSKVPVGCLLFSYGSPWYSDMLVYNEELTVAFDKGLGLARANYLTLKYLMSPKADLIQLSCANTPCKGVLENTYGKLGMEHYKTFYEQL